MKTEYTNIKLSLEGELAVVTVNRPKSMNALNSATLAELNEVFGEIAKSKEIRVVIVTGEGAKAFVAGADISEMVNATAIEGRAMGILAAEAFTKLDTMPQVTIAAVNGYALGGGCELASACDIRICSENAKFGQPETGLGILPGFGGTQRLAQLIGKGRAKELIFTCDMIDAAEAYRIGLANKVVPQEELMDTCRAMAAKILSKGSFAISAAKTAINASLDINTQAGMLYSADLFGLTFATEDKKEGMTAFLEKRKATLTDF